MSLFFIQVWKKRHLETIHLKPGPENRQEADASGDLQIQASSMRLGGWRVDPHIDVGQTMPFLPAMTGNGKFIPPTKMVMAGGWFYYCTHMIVNFSS